MGLVMKPIISGISEEGVPIGIKMAITVLTDEFVNQFPEWQVMRDAMRSKDVKLLTFDSAIKMGAPAESVKLNKKGTFDSIQNEALIDLDTNFFGLIYNPSAETISLDQANPSQMKFLPMTNPENMAQHHKLIELDGEMYRTGIMLLDRLLRLKDGKPSKKGITVTRNTSSGEKTVETNRTNESIRERLLKSFSRVAGSEAEWGLLYNLPNLSINLPVLTTKAVSAINALFTSKVTGQTYKGGKLVLAPEFGTYSAKNLQLKWKDKDGNTEVYLPESIARDMGIQLGDIVTMNMRWKGMGFRIPSTGLHSSISMVVKGFYPVPEGIDANIIIVPQRIVHIMGSDYDVDTMYFITRYLAKDLTADKEDFQLGKILSVINPRYNSDLVLDAFAPLGSDLKGNDIYYDEFGYPAQTGMKLHEFVQQVLDELETELKSLLALPKRTDEQKARLDALLGDPVDFKEGYSNSIENRMIELYQAALKNESVNIFIDIITDPKNNVLMETPISLGRMKSAVTDPELEESMLDKVAQYRGLNKEEVIAAGKDWKTERNKVLYPPEDPGLPTTQQNIHDNTNSGTALRGASSNALKFFSYLMLAARTTMYKGKKTGKIYTIKEIKDLGDGRLNRGIALLKTLEDDVFEIEKAPIKLDKGITLGGAYYDTISVTEKVLNKDGELVDNVVKVAKRDDGSFIEKVYTIFDTFDSLTNAAIDSVKEQIIYLMNFTNVTANPFFVLVGLGVPLDKITTFMIQPALINLSRRASFGSSNVKTEMQRVIALLKTKLLEKAKETGEDAVETNAKIEAITALILEQANLEDINSEQQLTDEELAALKEANRIKYKNLRKDIRRAAEKFLGESIQSIELTDEALRKASANFWKSPNGDYAHLDLEDIIVQYKVLAEYKNLSDVGEFVFHGSNLLNLLRQYPTEHWRLLES
jgi:hypothetical protein